MAQWVTNPHAVQEMWVRSLDREDPLEKEMAIHPSILAWRIPWTEEPGGLQSLGSQRVGHDLVTERGHMRVWVLLLPISLSYFHSNFRDRGKKMMGRKIC